MLHEIYPHNLDNQYRNLIMDKDSKCIAFRDNHILLKDGDLIDFPTAGEIGQYVDKKVYLFALDDIKYFIVNVQGEEFDGYSFLPMMEFRTKKPKEQVFAGMTAYHLYVWYRDNQFCGRCGSPVEHSPKERMVHCNKCNNSIYPKIMPAVIVAVTNGDKILVTRYKGRPYRGYALIAGFCEIGETGEETVAREVFEEAGVKVKNIRYYTTQPWGIAQDLLLGYFCEVDGDDTITIDEDELSYGEWIHRDDLDVVDEQIALTNRMLCMFKNGEHNDL